MLLDRNGIIGPALDCRVVADDHALLPLDAANAGDDGRGMDVILVHAKGRERRELEERRPRINQSVHALARQQFAPLDVALPGALIAATRRDCHALLQLARQPRHRIGIRAKPLITR